MQISPGNYDAYGSLNTGDHDFWGAPYFSAKVSLVDDPDKSEPNVWWIAVKVEATWWEQNPDYTTYKVADISQIVKLNPGQRLGDLGQKYSVETPQRPIDSGTNHGLVTVYDGNLSGNLLVRTIQADGDKKGRLDTPHLVISFRPNVTVPIIG